MMHVPSSYRGGQWPGIGVMVMPGVEQPPMPPGLRNGSRFATGGVSGDTHQFGTLTASPDLIWRVIVTVARSARFLISVATHGEGIENVANTAQSSVTVIMAPSLRSRQT